LRRRRLLLLLLLLFTATKWMSHALLSLCVCALCRHHLQRSLPAALSTVITIAAAATATAAARDA